MRLCSFKGTFLRGSGFIVWSVFHFMSEKAHGRMQAPKLKKLDKLCILSSHLPFAHALSTCVHAAHLHFLPQLLGVTQPWASSLHSLSRLLPPHPKAVGLSHFKCSLLLSLLFIYSLPHLVTGGPCSLYFNLGLKMLHFFLRVLVGLPPQRDPFLLALVFLSLRWKQPLFFPLYLFQLRFHLCTVAIFLSNSWSFPT